jgi:hypothetical protein
MSKIIEIIEKLQDLIKLNAASDDQINAAEKALNLKFAKEYREYLMVCGAIIAEGVELTGIAKSKARDVVAVTLEERRINKEVPDDFYVIENLGIEGIIVWQNEKGEIYETSSNNQVKKIYDSLSDYIMSKETT